MAALTFIKNTSTNMYEAEYTLEAGRFALHLEFEVTEESRTREVETEVEVDVLDPETNEPTGEKTTQTQTTTETYTVTIDNVSDNRIMIGRSVTAENYTTRFDMPFSGEVFDETFDGLVEGMTVLISTKNKPASGAIL